MILKMVGLLGQNSKHHGGIVMAILVATGLKIIGKYRSSASVGLIS